MEDYEAQEIEFWAKLEDLASGRRKRVKRRSSPSSGCSPRGSAAARPHRSNKQPLSIRLPTIQSQTELGVFLAAMFIACLVPVAGFLIFQRSFLRGSGLSGAIKG